MTQTFPGLSPTQSSVCLLGLLGDGGTVNTPSGPEVSLSPVKPANPGLGNGVTAPGCCVASTTSIALLLRSAKKNFLSFGSNQLMSNEKNDATPGTCRTVVTWNTSSFLKLSPGPSGWLKAGTATASMAMAPIPTPVASLFFDRSL